ncbi:MAG: hypothetical protein V4735_03180 [Pseudomonadota bacterium]
MTVQLQQVSSASGDKITAMLVNAILTDNHEDAKMAQLVIQTRGSMNEVPKYTQAVTDIASGLENRAKTRESGNGQSVA